MRILALFLTSVLVFGQGVGPSLIYAQEVLPPEASSSAETAEIVEPQPSLSPIPVSTPEPTLIPDPTTTPTPEATPSPGPAPIPVSDWQEESGEVTTKDNVVLDHLYIALQNSKVTVKFNKLPDHPGKLTIKEITLTDDQVKQTGALSKIAYDITSTMPDGVFEYTLTLPTPKTDNVEVKASEDGQTFVTLGGVTAQEDTLTITGLNHFTVFLVASPSASADASDVGTISWTGTANVYSHDTSYATASLNDNEVSHNLKATGFNLTVPSTATIQGILVQIEHKAGTASRIKDSSIKIIKSDSTLGSTNKADTVNYWPTSDTYASYGSSADLWGETWTAAQINSANFGVAISATKPVTPGGAITGSINHVKITVYYNTPPVANAVSDSTNEDTAKTITLSASDVDSGDVLTYTVVSNPNNGSLSGTGSTRTYTPNANFNGSDSFTYKANDGTVDSNTATVSITVNAVNDPPSFDAIANQTVAEDASSQNVIITNVSAGPSNESDQIVTLTATSSNPAVIPNPTVSGSGATRTLTYTPVINANGTATITVTANDGQAQNNTFSRTFSINVVALGSISGMKYEDKTGNPGLSGWTIVLSGDASATTTTDINGNYSFSQLLPGLYRMCEILQSGWVQTAPSSGYDCGNGLLGYELTLSSGENLTGKNFGNFNYGQISGKKYNDVNANGEDDTGEPVLSGWTIYIDSNNNGWLDGDEVSTTTDSSGHYTFSNLGPGTYTIREVQQNGWSQTDPTSSDSSLGGQDDGSYVVTMTSNGNKTQRNFGNFQLGTISGQKFDDTNGNGIMDGDEWSLEGWTIFLDSNNNGLLDEGEISTQTDEDGYYEFTNLIAGTYKVREVPEEGWVQTTNNPSDITVTSGTNQTGVDFGNFQKITISGKKFEDKNADGLYDDSQDIGLSGWTIYIDANGNNTLDGGERVATTSNYGSYSFDNLGPGTYKIREVPQNGWAQTTTNPADVVATSGTSVQNINFGNFKKVIITGYKWKDLDADGQLDKDEPGIGGWNMSLSKVTTTTTTTTTTTSTTNPDGGAPITTEMVQLSLVSTLPTDETGHASFSVGQPGIYRLTEESKDNFQKTFPADSFFDIFVEFSGQSNITTDKNNQPLHFGNAPFFQQFSGAKFVPTSGDSSATTSLLVLGQSTISVSATGGTSSVSLPDGTTITRSDGGAIDSSLLAAQNVSASSLSGLGSGIVAEGAMQWGIPNLGLVFSQPITLNIFVGTSLNGQMLNIIRSVSGSADWTSNGIVAPATCVVASGVCTFQATKASYYATTRTVSTTTTTTSGGGDGTSGLSSASAPVCNDAKPGSSPTLLSARATASNEVTLTWSKATSPVTYYLVTYGTVPGLQEFGNPNVGGPDTTSYIVRGLPQGNYYFRVRAGNGCMPGDFSNELSASVGGAAISGPAAGFAPGVLGKKTTEEGKTGGEATPAPQILGEQGQTPSPKTTAKGAVGGVARNATVVVGVIALISGLAYFVRRKMW